MYKYFESKSDLGSASKNSLPGKWMEMHPQIPRWAMNLLAKARHNTRPQFRPILLNILSLVNVFVIVFMRPLSESYQRYQAL